MIAPVYLNLTPEGKLIILEYRQYLQENMNDKAFQIITTKGIVNILP